MSLYHVRENGEPGLCQAQINCPLGGEHFPTPEEARKAYEVEMTEAAIGKALRKALFRAYSEVEKEKVVFYALDLADDMQAAPEHLPPVDDPMKLDAIDEEEGYIDSLEAFKDPAMAMNNCVTVAEAVMLFQNDEAIGFIEQEVAGPYLNVHAANTYRDPAGNDWIIDYTYSQVDPKADWPWVGSPNEWKKNVQQAGFTPSAEIKALYRQNSDS